jgi:hypothetical protein
MEDATRILSIREFVSADDFVVVTRMRMFYLANVVPHSQRLCQLPSRSQCVECESELFDDSCEVGMQVSEAADAYCAQPTTTDISATIAMNVFMDSPFFVRLA